MEQRQALLQDYRPCLVQRRWPSNTKAPNRAELELGTDLTPEFVALFVRKGAGIMPPFRPTELSGDDLKALGAYLARKHSKPRTAA